MVVLKHTISRRPFYFMLYTVNVKLLRMIQNSRWIPSDVNALEKLLNTKIVGINVDTILPTIFSWFNEINSKINPKINSKSNVQLRNNTDFLIPNNKDIILILRCLLQYYKTLIECSNEIININETKKNPNLKGVTADNEINKIIVSLQKYEDMYFNDNFNVDTEELFRALAKYLHPICNEVWKISLKNELSQRQIKELYIQFLNCGISLYDLINLISDTMFTLYSSKWVNNVLSDKNLNKYTMSHSKFKINQPQNIIISFCDNIVKYENSSQDIISSSLFNTKDLVSADKEDKAFHDRSFGFMYNFSKDTILGMNMEDTYSYNITLNSYLEILSALFQGIPLCSNFCVPQEDAPVYALAKVIQMSSLGLKPIYDLDELKSKTFTYNEIVLSSTAKPYGIFVWEKRLSKCFSQVCSLSTVMHIPLFICRQDGSLLIINWQNVFEDVKKYLEKMATKQP